MPNKFLIEDLSSIASPLLSSDYAIVESSGITHKIDIQSLYKDVLSNRLALSASRATDPGGANTLSILFKNDDNSYDTLHAQTLQDGMLSAIKFDPESNVLSLYFNVAISASQTSVEISLSSLKDVYQGGKYISVEDNEDYKTINVNISTNFDLNNNKIINVATPFDSSDAATKSYVDGISGNIFELITSLST